MSAKPRLREALLERRTHLSADAMVAAERRLCAGALAVVREVGTPRRVAAYLSVGREPPTWELVDALRAEGMEVLVPRSLPRRQIAWAPYEGRDRLVLGRFDIPESSAPVAPDGLGTVAVVLVPALAVDVAGFRLGRGGGYYDTTLAKHPEPLRVALTYDHELVDDVHPEAHDERVDVVVTPERTLSLPPR
ncbi:MULTISPECIES: 5-formyltetrahydrofolate cyclo-ligase [Mumia]|uniref:5-formyltetrahydrofolate cyclo-ligase n=1 Tax=Mumia TaxID=1546255 RepID=UPI001420C794|nr:MULTISPECIES: 5-formyltetrahydrofolate cyclo-ligase [unclassified Mumia]QMW67084.1 5-formyltetrahydrofolate cyclo-ligase [Mumia sp. ZJ1417]